MADPFSILIVAPRLPMPLGKADSRTVYHMIKFLADRGHRVHLATFSAPEDPASAVEPLEALCASVDVVPLQEWKSKLQLGLGLLTPEPMQVWYYRYATMREAVQRIVRQHQPDVLYGHLLRSAPYLLHYTQHKKALGLQIAYTLNYRRLVEHLKQPLMKAFYAVEYQKVKRYEPKVIPAFERVLLISPHDKEAVDPEGRFDNVFFNPHGIEADFYGERLGLERVPGTIVMNADFEAPTNVDAALFFYQEIFPLVRAAVPEARLWLVGRKPAPAIRRLADDPAVEVTGFVEDLREYLQRGAVAIDPLRIGAGLQNKVLVSMAAGMPVVATRIANEGIQVPEGSAILLADEPEAFAEHVIRLLQNEDEQRQIGEQGRAFVQRYWTWEYHFERFEEMLAELVCEGAERPVEQYYPFSTTETVSA